MKQLHFARRLLESMDASVKDPMHSFTWRTVASNPHEIGQLLKLGVPELSTRKGTLHLTNYGKGDFTLQETSLYVELGGTESARRFSSPLLERETGHQSSS